MIWKRSRADTWTILLFRVNLSCVYSIVVKGWSLNHNQIFSKVSTWNLPAVKSTPCLPFYDELLWIISCRFLNFFLVLVANRIFFSFHSFLPTMNFSFLTMNISVFVFSPQSVFTISKSDCLFFLFLLFFSFFFLFLWLFVTRSYE